MFASLAPGAVRRALAPSDLGVADSDAGEAGGAALHAGFSASQVGFVQPGAARSAAVVVVTPVRPDIQSAQEAVASNVVVPLVTPANGPTRAARVPDRALRSRYEQETVPAERRATDPTAFGFVRDTKWEKDLLEAVVAARNEPRPVEPTAGSDWSNVSVAGLAALAPPAREDGALPSERTSGLLTLPLEVPDQALALALAGASGTRLDPSLLDVLALGLLCAGALQTTTGHAASQAQVPLKVISLPL